MPGDTSDAEMRWPKADRRSSQFRINDNYSHSTSQTSHLKNIPPHEESPPMNHNPNPTSHLPWCAPQNQEAITQAILQNTRTQFQFSPDQPADGSDECAEDKSAEGFR